MRPLNEIIQRAGDRLKTQGLAQSLVSMRQKKDHAELTFQTEKELASIVSKQATGVREPSMVGIVVWIPANAFEEQKGSAS